MRLTGGGGSDRFYFASPDEGVDIITDSSAADRVEVEDLGFGGGLEAGQLQPLSFSVQVRKIPRIGLSTTAALVLCTDSDGTGNTAWVQLATLSGSPLACK